MRRTQTACLLSACGVFLTLAGAWAQTPDDGTASPAVAPAALVLGDTVLLRLYNAASGQTPQQRVDALTTRITNLLGIPGILPSDVVVYAPKSGPPSIYALGRRIVTVDAPTAQAEHLGTPLQVAKTWAARLQQILPRINWRPNNAPEPVIPANPPLLVTDDFTKVGGAVGAVNLRGKDVLFFYGPQKGGLTAQERADLTTSHLYQLARRLQASAPGPSGSLVQIVPLPTPPKAPAGPGAVEIRVGGTPVVDVTSDVARAAGAGSPQMLAQAWAKNLRRALALPDDDALPIIPTAPVPNQGG